MTGPRPEAEWLAAQAARRPRVVARAGRIIAAGDRSNDAILHGRQVLERGLHADPETVYTAEDYWYAAAAIDGTAPAGQSEILAAMAETDGELRAGWPQWNKRYAGRPETASERLTASRLITGTLRERGDTVLGVDGCYYTQAFFAHTGKPAIVVTNSALVEDAAVFPALPHAKAWWVSRQSAAGPLMTTADIPLPSRSVHEEEILAWLMKNPRDTAAVTAELGPVPMTSHLRAELLGALQWTTRHGGSPDCQLVAEAYGRRLLRAPGPLAAAIGWPGATRANSYLNRIVATPVTSSQAHAAAAAVARADAEARPQARTTLPAPLRTEVTGHRQTAGTAAPRAVSAAPPPSPVFHPASPVQRP